MPPPSGLTRKATPPPPPTAQAARAPASTDRKPPIPINRGTAPATPTSRTLNFQNPNFQNPVQSSRPTQSPVAPTAGMRSPAGISPAPLPAVTSPTGGAGPMRSPGARRLGGLGAGSVIRHPKYGRGTILRREGEGEDAKLTISFPGHGLKKIVEKFAGIKVDE
jgi:hypothetical protein